jgi:hypothetical protein
MGVWLTRLVIRLLILDSVSDVELSRSDPYYIRSAERCISDGVFLLRDFPCHKAFWHVGLMLLIQPVLCRMVFRFGM